MEDTIYFADNFPSQWIDAAYQLVSREVEELDKIVYGVVRQKAIADKIFPKIQIAKGAKTHTIATEIEQEAPKFDDNFMREDLDEVRKETSSFYPVFMHKDFYLYMTDIDASRSLGVHNVDLRGLTLRGSVETIMDYREKVIWRGYDIRGPENNSPSTVAANRQGSIDTAAKGIINTTNVQSFGAGAGADANITAAGDGAASVANGMRGLVAYHYFGPYDLAMTGYAYAALVKNQNATTGQTDLERMKAMVDKNGVGILRAIHVTEYLTNSATSATGTDNAMLMFDRRTPKGEPTCVIGDEYSVAHYPTSQSALGIKGKVLYAGIPCVLRPYAFNAEASIKCFTA